MFNEFELFLQIIQNAVARPIVTSALTVATSPLEPKKTIVVAVESS